MKIIDAPQGSQEWLIARAGRVTGSKADAVMAGATTAKRADYRLQLAVERITGTPEIETFTNAYMQHGTETEPRARLALEAHLGVMVRETGFIEHASLPIGCSLDGDVDDFAAIVELKAPKSTTHVGYLEGGKLPTAYQWQVTHNLLVTGADRCIFASYDYRLPPGLQLFVVEVNASDMPLEEYSAALTKFLGEVDAVEAKLRAMQRTYKEAA